MCVLDLITVTKARTHKVAGLLHWADDMSMCAIWFYLWGQWLPEPPNK